MKQQCREYLDGQFAGDEESIKEIYEEYVRSYHEKLGDSREALASGDWTKLDRAAHTLKGNALAVGDTSVADAAIELRLASKLQNAADSERLIAALEELEKTL